MPVPPRPFRFGVTLRHPADQRDWLEAARKAEALGYSVVSVPDHIHARMSAIPTLAAIAVATSTIRLGTFVLCIDFRNLVLLAKDAAAVDLLSTGRFELGLGAGWMVRDYEQLGLALDPIGVRISRLREAVPLVKDLLAGKAVTHRGDYFEMKDVTCYPPSVQQPHPPILIGGSARRILGLAGEMADIVSIMGPSVTASSGEPAGFWAKIGPDDVKQRIEWARNGAGSRFDQIELQLGIRMGLAVVTDQRRSHAEELGARFGLTANEIMATPYAMVGSIDQIAEDLQQRRETLGISYWTLSEDNIDDMAPLVARLAGK